MGTMSEVDFSETHGSLEEFVSAVGEYYNNPDLSDVVLKVGQQSFYAHKFVLAKSSDVLKTMLTNCNWKDSSQYEVPLEESQECIAVFSEFLKYMYFGQVTLSIHTAFPLLCLADKYNVLSLRSICSVYMGEKVLKQQNVSGALLWLPHSRRFGLKSMSDNCLDVIVSQLSSVVESPEWLKLDIQLLCEILQSSDLVIKDEYVLYKAVEKWLLQSEYSTQIEKNIDRIMPLIRFSQLEPTKLYVIECSELAKRFPILMKPLIGEAYRFYTLARSMKQEFQEEKYFPRCYSSALYCCREQNIKVSTIPVREHLCPHWYLDVFTNDGFFSFPENNSSEVQSCSKWLGSCHKRDCLSLSIKLYPGKEHAGKKYRVHVILESKDGQILSIYRKSGLVEERGEEQLHHGLFQHHGPSASVGFSYTFGSGRSPFSQQASNVCGPMFGAKPENHQAQRGLFGCSALINVPQLPSVAPIVIETKCLELDMKINLSIGVVLLS